MSLFFLLNLHRHTDHFLFSFLIRFPIYTVAAPFFFHISSSAGNEAVSGRQRNINSMPCSLTESVWHMNCSGYDIVLVG